MASDMKEATSQVLWQETLLTKPRARRPKQAKDIVEECRITRQAFHYHFEDIPALFRWMLERDTARTVQEIQAVEGGEARLTLLFRHGHPRHALHEKGHAERLPRRAGAVFEPVYPASFRAGVRRGGALPADRHPI